MLLRAENWLVSGRGDTELLDAEQRTQNSGRRTADAEQRDGRAYSSLHRLRF